MQQGVPPPRAQQQEVQVLCAGTEKAPRPVLRDREAAFPQWPKLACPVGTPWWVLPVSLSTSFSSDRSVKEEVHVRRPQNEQSLLQKVGIE